MEQKELNEYWSFFDNELKNFPEIYQRKVSFAFCELVKSGLDELGLQGFKMVQDLATGKKHGQKEKSYQKKLQASLPKEGHSLYSVLIWALEPNTSTYPPFMAAGMAGLNVADMEIAKLHELVALARKAIMVS